MEYKNRYCTKVKHYTTLALAILRNIFLHTMLTRKWETCRFSSRRSWLMESDSFILSLNSALLSSDPRYSFKIGHCNSKERHAVPKYIVISLQFNDVFWLKMPNMESTLKYYITHHLKITYDYLTWRAIRKSMPLLWLNRYYFEILETECTKPL